MKRDHNPHITKRYRNPDIIIKRSFSRRIPASFITPFSNRIGVTQRAGHCSAFAAHHSPLQHPFQDVSTLMALPQITRERKRGRGGDGTRSPISLPPSLPPSPVRRRRSPPTATTSRLSAGGAGSSRAPPAAGPPAFQCAVRSRRRGALGLRAEAAGLTRAGGPARLGRPAPATRRPDDEQQ